jgi:hypothetical protein
MGAENPEIKDKNKKILEDYHEADLNPDPKGGE